MEQQQDTLDENTTALDEHTVQFLESLRESLDAVERAQGV